MTDNEYQIYWREQFEAAQREIAEMAMTQALLVAALKEVEYVPNAAEGMEGFHYCPWCGMFNDQHADGCHRQLALKCCNFVADKKEDAVEASPSIRLMSR